MCLRLSLRNFGTLFNKLHNCKIWRCNIEALNENIPEGFNKGKLQMFKKKFNDRF